MRFYTGDESGLLKVVDIDPKVSFLEAQAQAAKKVRADAKAKFNAKEGESVEVKENILMGVTVATHHGTVSRTHMIQQMELGKYDGQEAFFIARRSGAVDAVSKATGEVLWQTESDDGFLEKLNVKSNGKIISERNYTGMGLGQDRILTCTNMGEVQYQRFGSQLDQDGEGPVIGRMQLAMDIIKMRAHSEAPNVFAVGGREVDLSIWDANTAMNTASGDGGSLEYSKPQGEALFKARNVRNDWLDLRVPVWLTDMQFIDSNTSTPQVAVSTGHGHIRIYDTRAQQRPVKNWALGKQPLTHLCQSHVKPELFFSDNLGNLRHLDMRTGRVVGGYKGISGAVTDIALSEDGRLVGQVGLDRFLRVYEADGQRRLKHRAYIKQRVTRVVWDWSVKDVDQDEIERLEADEIWSTMATTSRSSSKRSGNKRKANDA
ncbi:Ribosome biogenesis protein nsa1 (NOP7-associated protein 1) [Coemansia sp. Benny D115]|nr:Ribosome biogenesis protein nsa1 (NOP7-associated protein 1) [Coemansia sp. Benny D115]